MEVRRAARFVAGGALYQRYLAGDPAVAGRFHYPLPGPFADPPADPPAGPPAVRSAAWAGALGRAAAVDREYAGDRAGLARALVELNRRLGAPPEALAGAAALGEPGSLALVTGQQAGLLGGPLYTLYKAAGALSLARALASGLGRRVIPVFWAATEDHDLAEVDHVWVMDRGQAWARLEYRPGPAPPGRSVGAIPLDGPELNRLLSELAAVLPGGYPAAEALALARSSAAGAATWGEWFCRLVAAIYGRYGLVVLDPMDPALRRLAAPGVAALLTEDEPLREGLRRGEAAVRELGLEPQLRVKYDDTQLFWYPQGPSGRRAALPRREVAMASRREILAWVDREPDRFSGSVVARPLLQDFILPTVGYLAGPSEIAYYAMLRHCYEATGRTMPLVWPRPGYTVVEPAIERLLQKHGLSAPALPGDLDAAVQAAVRRADQLGIDARFDQVASSIDHLYAGLVPTLAGADPGLGRLAGQNRDRIQREVTWLRRKAWQVARQRAGVATGQLERVRNHLWPRGGPQERNSSLIGLLARCGMPLAADLAALDPGPPFDHRYLVLR